MYQADDTHVSLQFLHTFLVRAKNTELPVTCTMLDWEWASQTNVWCSLKPNWLKKKKKEETAFISTDYSVMPWQES